MLANPPSNGTVTPVIKVALSEARKMSIFAASSTVPRQPRGKLRAHMSSCLITSVSVGSRPCTPLKALRKNMESVVAGL